MRREDITPELCRLLMSYDPDTGALTWTRRPRSMSANNRAHSVWNANWPGKPALNAPDRNGYRIGMVCGVMMKSHRVAWMIHYGEVPDVIDHIDGDGGNNRIANLRNVSRAANMRNQKRRSNNTSSVTGVWREGNRWAVEIKHNGEKHWLGRYDTLGEATAVRKAAEARMDYHPNHGRA